MNNKILSLAFIGLVSQGFGAFSDPCSTGMMGNCKDKKTAYICLQKKYPQVSAAIDDSYKNGFKVNLSVANGTNLMITNEENKSQTTLISKDDGKCLSGLTGEMTPFMSRDILAAGQNKKNAAAKLTANAENAKRYAAEQERQQKALLAEFDEVFTKFKKEMIYVSAQIKEGPAGKARLCLEANPRVESLVRQNYGNSLIDDPYSQRPNAYKRDAEGQCFMGANYNYGGNFNTVDNILPVTFVPEIYLVLNPDIKNTIGAIDKETIINHYITIGAAQGKKFLPITVPEYNAVVAAGHQGLLNKIISHFENKQYLLFRS